MFDGLIQLFGYRMNSRTLDELADDGIGSETIRRIQPLVGEYFPTAKALTKRFRPLLVSEQTEVTDEQLKLIVARAYRPRLKRLGNAIGNLIDFYVPPSTVTLPMRSCLAIAPLSLFLRLRFRYHYFALRNFLARKPLIRDLQNDNATGFVHNREQMLDFSFGHRKRTERIMNVLRSVEACRPASDSILVVGPRNEAEVLLLRAYGFRSKNIEAIDLFTYSPAISLMDMNNTSYPADAFDIYYSSAVIRYSPDIRQTVRESIRVTRNGGLMVFGFTYGGSSNLVPKGAELLKGIVELLELYAGNVDHVYWHENYYVSDDDIRAAVIFRLKK